MDNAAETPAAAAARDRKGDLGTPSAFTRAEMAAVVVLGVISAIVVAILADGMWFQKDAWDYFAFRELSTFSSLMEPHGDHWVLPTSFVMRVLYRTVGLDFWPWYYVPRLVGHVLMIIALWAVLRRRGTERLVAFGAFAVLLFMGTSSWQLPSTTGNLIVFPMLWLSALLVWRVDRPSVWQRLALFGMLLFGISANSMGVAGIAGFGLATLLYGRVKQWWPSIAGVGLIYVWWYLTYRGFGATSGATVPGPFDTIDLIAGIVGDAFTRTLGIPELLGVLFVVGFLVFIGWLVKTRRLDVFDASLLLTLAVYFGLILSIRFAGGGASAEHVRWSQRVALLIVPVVLPRIRIGRQAWAKAVLVAVFLVALVGNLVQLADNLDGEVRRSVLRQSFAESAAQLVGDGEPYLSRRRLNQARTGQLTSAGLESLVEDGWAPSRRWGEEALQDARARLRMSIAAGGRIRGVPPTTTLPLTETDDGTCLTVPADGEAEMLVTRRGEIRLRPIGAARIDLVWVDEFGTGVWQRADLAFPRRGGYVTLMDPVTSATLTVVSHTGETEVCGLAEG